MERLTLELDKPNKLGDKYILYFDWESPKCNMERFTKAHNKLGKLEDILEKHNIESIEQLDNVLGAIKSIFDRYTSYDLDAGFYDDSFSLTKEQKKALNDFIERNLENAN